MSRKEGFLERWSRLKEVGEPPEIDTPEAPAGDEAIAEAAEVDERSDEEILAELGLPDPDNLTLGDDVAGFMSKAVPDRLRRRALRQLWRANPVLANLDGLVEYGEDYTDSAMVVENLQTLYQVGKGMFVEPEELEEEEVAADDGLEEAEKAEETPEIAIAEDEPVDEVEETALVEVEDASDAPPQATVRRMTFS